MNKSVGYKLRGFLMKISKIDWLVKVVETWSAKIYFTDLFIYKLDLRIVGGLTKNKLLVLDVFFSNTWLMTSISSKWGEDEEASAELLSVEKSSSRQLLLQSGQLRNRLIRCALKLTCLLAINCACCCIISYRQVLGTANWCALQYIPTLWVVVIMRIFVEVKN